MLEQMRNSSRSFLIWILFAIIIGAFVLTFGPGEASLACSPQQTFAVRVNGSDVSVPSWRFAMNGLQLAQTPENRFIALDYLVERELLAQAALERGFRISDDLVNESLGRGEVWLLGHRIDGRNAYFRDGVFDYETLERFAAQLGVGSVPNLLEEQRREHLAQMMRAVIVSAIAVSAEEARSEFIQDNTTIKADYVMFDVARYAAAMKLDEAALKRYAAGHESELKERWEIGKAQWEKAQEWTLARHIFIAKDPPPPPKVDGEAPVEPAKPSAKDRAAAIAARLAKGEDFATVAREVSEDQRSRLRGGSLGWRPATSLGWGSKIVEAAKALEIGAISDVVAGDRGFHILVVDEKTDSALTFEQKKTDLAASLAARYYANKRAELDAVQALARAETTPLAELFERGAAPPSFPSMPGADQLTPEQLQQLKKLMEEQARKKGQTGWIIREGRTILAQTGDESGSVPAEPAPAPPADEVIPEPSDLAPPPLRTVGPVSRSGDFMPGIGRSKELVDALFDHIAPTKLGDQAFRVTEPEGWVIVQLSTRSLADLEQFKEQGPQLAADLRERKATVALSKWLEQRCKDTATAGGVEIDPTFMEISGGTNEDPKKPPPAYTACANLSLTSVAQQQATQRAVTGSF